VRRAKSEDEGWRGRYQKASEVRQLAREETTTTRSPRYSHHSHNVNTKSSRNVSSGREMGDMHSTGQFSSASRPTTYTSTTYSPKTLKEYKQLPTPKSYGGLGSDLNCNRVVVARGKKEREAAYESQRLERKRIREEERIKEEAAARIIAEKIAADLAWKRVQEETRARKKREREAVIAEVARKAAEAQRVEDERVADEAKKIADEARKVEIAKRAVEDAKRAVEQRAADLLRKADERRAEELRIASGTAEEAQREEEHVAALAEITRSAEEKRAAGKVRRVEEMQRAEEHAVTIAAEAEKVEKAEEQRAEEIQVVKELRSPEKEEVHRLVLKESRDSAEDDSLEQRHTEKLAHFKRQSTSLRQEKEVCVCVCVCVC
jgi:hypothetical protein